MDLEEFNAGAARDAGGLVGLLLQRRQQGLEPFKRARVFADPDELDTTKTGRGVGRVAHVPDVLEDGCPGRDTNSGSDQHGDFIVEDVFSGCSIGAVDPETRHLLAVLQCHFIHAHGINALIELRLSTTCSRGITQSTGEISDLSDVNGHIGVERAGCDGEGVPLVFRNRRHLEEQPLTGLVLERWLVELNLNHVVWVADNSSDFGLPAGTHFAVQSFDEVETASPELPAPAEIADTVSPVWVAGKR